MVTSLHPSNDHLTGENAKNIGTGAGTEQPTIERGGRVKRSQRVRPRGPSRDSDTENFHAGTKEGSAGKGGGAGGQAAKL